MAGIALEVLNTIRANASEDYQNRIPEATQNNIAEIGRSFQTYDLVYNEFVEALIHKIGKTYIETKSFNNKLKRFKTGTISTMQDVEDIFIETLRTAEGSYDKDGGMGEGATNHPLKRRQPQDVKVMYHRMNRQDYYAITIEKIDVIRAFRSESALNQFIAGQLNSMYAGAEYDEWTHMKELLAEAIGAGDMKTYLVSKIDDSATDANIQKACKNFIRTAKKAVADAGYFSTELNPAKVNTKSEKNELVMFIQKDIAPHLDVDLYSSIFGPGYANLDIEIVELDNFGSDTTGTYALIVDKDWFRVFDTLNEIRQQENAVGLYTTYFLHIWQILSYCKFKTAIRLGFDDVVAGA